MSLFQSSGLFRGGPRSGAGYFALGGKVTKTPPGFPRTPFCPIGRSQVRTAQPLKRHFLHLICGGYLVQLRLTAF